MAQKGRVTVVGGGSAGLVAAVVAAREGAAVTVLERMPRVGKKLLVTGNGRCNLTNVNLDAGRYHGRHPGFVRESLGRFDLRRTLDFFEGLGITARVEEEGKVFPLSGQASAVLDVLRHELERLGVEVVCEAEASRLGSVRGGFRIQAKDGRRFEAGRVILAAGGRAAPNLGSNGSGYPLAEGLGHRIVEPFPALTKLRLATPFLKRLMGVKFTGEASLEEAGRLLRRESGEVLFTETGVSGPPILQLSRAAGERLGEGRKISLVLDLFPDFEPGRLPELLGDRFRAQASKDLEFGLVGFLHKKLIPVLLAGAGLPDRKRPCSSLLPGEIAALAGILKRWPFAVTGTASWMDAQVTAGGVDVSDVDPVSLESKLVPGLFFAGEILDVDGDCGGYNLQWAWSSGHAAGLHAARVP